MKKALKIFAITILCIIILGVATALYIFRSQEIDIGLIPNEFTYCGKQIWGKDKKYQEIFSWLRNNKDGWRMSFVSYVPQQVYRHPAFVVNVLEGGVIVSYKTDHGYPQYEKTIDHNLNLECTENR